MSLKVRSILVLVVGTVLGLTVSLGTNLIAQRKARHAEEISAALPPQYQQLLSAVIERVRREYVDQIDDERLVEGAIRGIISELDQHSRFLDSTEYEDIKITTTGNYSGIGLDVSLEDGRVTVVNPLAGAPAARAGIRAGDVVVSVDEIPVDEANMATAVGRMRGEPGTNVTLDVVRDGSDEPMRFALTRAEIQVRTVQSQYLGDGYAYVRLSGFSDTTSADLAEAARSLDDQAQHELRGLVLDLRNNPGGVLEAAIEVADLFLDDGLIVRGNGRIHQARFAQYAHAGGPLEHVPLSVLVNAGSASASEIVAGALKDNHRARLVGQRTYGKASVQSVVPIGGGNAIKLTTSRYLTPSGRSINGIGIEPDVVISEPDMNLAYHGPDSQASVDDDVQLTEALRLIGYDPIALSKAP
jgi:carboxyl-terminal processing protease